MRRPNVETSESSQTIGPDFKGCRGQCFLSFGCVLVGLFFVCRLARNSSLIWRLGVIGLGFLGSIGFLALGFRWLRVTLFRLTLLCWNETSSASGVVSLGLNCNVSNIPGLCQGSSSRYDRTGTALEPWESESSRACSNAFRITSAVNEDQLWCSPP